jgi:ADP-ribose pyrophosphatase YjhB (NUDIX family)
MQQKGVPNDLYNYHLQYLVKKGLVTKEGEGYALSPIGMRYVADAHAASDAFNSYFKINVILIVSRVVDGKVEILNQVRKSHPSYGKVGAPGGVVLKEEPVEAAASRKLREETGLEATFKHVGMERRIMYRDGDLFSDLLFPLCYANACTGELLVDTEFGHNTWVPIDEAIENESALYDSIPSIITVLRAIQDGPIERMSYFFVENTQGL